MAKLLLSIVLVALVASTSAFPRRLKLWPSRIVGGEEVEVGSVPHQISFQYYGSHICGGSILNANWIITAAHCADVGSASSFSIVAGVHNIRTPEATAQTVQVSAKVVHENYDDWTINNDIALLKLASPLKLGEDLRAQAVPLATHNVTEGTDATITGWGTTSSGGSLPAALRTVTVPVVSDEKCREAYGEEDIAHSMICAGHEQGGKDSCQGDSGGPLVVKNEKGETVLAGIVSWGYGCAVAGYPGVYTEVSHFVDWVNKQVASH